MSRSSAIQVIPQPNGRVPLRTVIIINEYDVDRLDAEIIARNATPGLTAANVNVYLPIQPLAGEKHTLIADTAPITIQSNGNGLAGATALNPGSAVTLFFSGQAVQGCDDCHCSGAYLASGASGAYIPRWIPLGATYTGSNGSSGST